MSDRFDVREPEPRDRRGCPERHHAGRGATGGGSCAEQFRDGFVRDLDLPSGPAREFVRTRDRIFELNGQESRLLADIGAFRVVAERDLEASVGRSPSARQHVTHLKAEGLLQRTLSAPDERVVSLTAQGRELLEAHRRDSDDGRRTARQAFYAGVRKPRELSHDTQVYRAYLHAQERLSGRGSRVRRVVLDYELKREYQRFLQARNRGRKDHDGRPDREPEEIRLWAREHDLPYFDDAVHLPDLRIEYEDRDGRLRHEDVEVTTAHYRGAHAAATARCGFLRYRSPGFSAGGRRGGRRGAPPDPRLAEELL
jgi:hypothetical protein